MASNVRVVFRRLGRNNSTIFTAISTRLRTIVGEKCTLVWNAFQELRDFPIKEKADVTGRQFQPHRVPREGRHSSIEVTCWTVGCPSLQFLLLWTRRRIPSTASNHACGGTCASTAPSSFMANSRLRKNTRPGSSALLRAVPGDRESLTGSTSRGRILDERPPYACFLLTEKAQRRPPV